MSDGVKPPGSADKQLGEIVGEVTQKASLLVREEIALAKAEVALKVKRLGRGAIFFAVAGVALFYCSIYLFVFLALGLNDWFALKPWVGFMFITVGFLIITIVGVLLGVRAFKKGSPPVPELAIEEAKRTRAALEEVRR